MHPCIIAYKFRLCLYCHRVIEWILVKIFSKEESQNSEHRSFQENKKDILPTFQTLSCFLVTTHQRKGFVYLCSNRAQTWYREQRKNVKTISNQSSQSMSLTIDDQLIQMTCPQSHSQGNSPPPTHTPELSSGHASITLPSFIPQIAGMPIYLHFCYVTLTSVLLQRISITLSPLET